ncbi:MAG: hypothetical protein GDA54_02185 [Alphaproteobacteria bacterium GM7ARS4]|nr:hypothetical protein [Alphaproteobacteria bacterium GM7ARS4]
MAKRFAFVLLVTTLFLLFVVFVGEWLEWIRRAGTRTGIPLTASAAMAASKMLFFLQRWWWVLSLSSF